MEIDDPKDIGGESAQPTGGATTSASGAPPAGGGTSAPSAPPAPGAAAATAQPAAAQTPQPQHENLGQKVIHSVLDALGGTEEVAYRRATDDDVKQGLAKEQGQMIASHTKMGPGQQWKRIIAGGLAGAAAGASVRPGPGAVARGVGAGIKTGLDAPKQQDDLKRKHADEDFEVQQKATAQKANLAYLAQETTAKAMETKRIGLDIDAKSLDGFKSLQEQLAGNPNNHQLGSFSSIDEFLKWSPELQKRVATELPHGMIQPVIGPDGSVTAYAIDQQWDKQKLDKDMPFRRVLGYDKNGKPQYATETVKAGTMTNGQYRTAVMGQWDKEHGDAMEAYKQDQQTKRTGMQQTGETERTNITQNAENTRAAEKGTQDVAAKALQKEASAAAEKVRPMANLLESAEKYYGNGNSKYNSADDLGLIIQAVRSMNPGTVRLPQKELELELKRGTLGQQAQRWYDAHLKDGTLPKQYREELMGVIRRETTTAATGAAKDWARAYGGTEHMPSHLQRFAGAVTPDGGGGAQGGGGFFEKHGGKPLQ